MSNVLIEETLLQYSVSIILDIIVPRDFIQIHANGSLAIGQAYTLTCSVLEGNITTYQWRKDNSILTTERGPSLSFAALELTDVGIYTCEVTVDDILYRSDKTVTISSKPSNA